jgi:hypothetical protein
MKKAQSQKVILFVQGHQKSFRVGIPELSFSMFIKIMPCWNVESIHSPYIQLKNHRDSWKTQKAKSPNPFRIRAFFVGPEGLEPPTR